MKAVCWHSANEVKVDTVADPEILNPHDAILRVTSTAICGSDLHLYGGYIPTMEKGDILGHEFMGEVVDVGSKVVSLKKGDRIVVPFHISCGHCFFCERTQWSLCDNTNPNASTEEKVTWYPTAGIFGFSHMYGGYAGGQAQYVRVPLADTNHLRVPNGIPDEKVLFLTDIFPTGYMAAEACNIQRGDTIAVWGCGPVGQFAIRSALLLGAERVIAIDRFPERLNLAAQVPGVEVLNYTETKLLEVLREMTGGRGPDACIDAVGMEAHGTDLAAWYDTVKQTLKLETDRPMVLREAIMACRKGGVISIPGVYSGVIDKLPMGVAFAKGLTFRMGQTHVHRYLDKLLHLVENETIDPSFVISHVLPLSEAPRAYELFKNKLENCTKVVMKPF